jgi:signal peptidase II
MRYVSKMPRRWRLALALVFGVLFADQVTKMLAVQHLTPGIAASYLADRGETLRDRAHQRDVNREIGFLEATRKFYSVESPCNGRGSMCPEVRVIDGFWSWRYAENVGAAFSLFRGMNESFRLPMLLGFAVIAVIFMFVYVHRLTDDQLLLTTSLGLIIGGALGNFADRLHLGYVIDFILWYQGSFRWPVFNVADSAIVVGGCLIGLSSIIELVQQRRQGHGSVAES